MILDRFRLDGKVALVTGAGRGIGRGCALALAEMGADVVCAARTRDQIEDTAGRIRGLGRRALALPCDVMEGAQLEAVVAETLRELGRVDVLVNNAGGSPPRPALDTSERMFDRAFHFNVTTAFRLCQLVVPPMREGGGGSIVNISSGAGRLVQSGFAAYGTAKAGLSFLTRSLAAEFAPEIRVNAVEVGAVATSALLPYLDGELRAKMEAMTPLGRIGEVEDVALAVLYLASPAASWVTGKLLEVDGGTVASNWPRSG